MIHSWLGFAIAAILLAHLAVDNNFGLVHTTACTGGSSGSLLCVERWRVETRPYSIIQGSDDFKYAAEKQDAPVRPTR